MEELRERIGAEIKRVYAEAIDPLGSRFGFEKRPAAGEIVGPAKVIFLGNHSSGKSTFINYVLGQEIQKTGLAPTDDSFTILTYGSPSAERDGYAVVSNPELPYEALAQFGPQFLSHFRMRLRPVELLRNVTLIDTPGMIDMATEGSGRGYDFAAAVRWFAERADVVLMFFDPHKPGTTGETLQIFTHSLHGIDHNLRIVMNKMDEFRSLRDFARTYGALCWNLGKVISRKDLPHIYTTFVPVDTAGAPALPASDFEQAREEVIQEIQKAPGRRLDNMLTQLEDHARRLCVHVEIIDGARRELGRFRFNCWASFVLLLLLLAGAGALALYQGAEWTLPAIIFGVAALVAWIGWFCVRWLVRREESRIVSDLTAIFEKRYARQLVTAGRSEDLRAVWQAVHPRARHTLEALGVFSFGTLKTRELNRLRRALDEEIPALRQEIARSTLGARSDRPAASLADGSTFLP